MKKFCLFSAAIAALFSAPVNAEVEKEGGVLVLTDANFDEELAKHDYLLVEFYAPWCGHCKQLAPEYEKAAERLAQNDPAYYVAKVDATANDELAQRFAIKGFPTLFFFKHGAKVEYNGGRREPEISDWVLKKVGPSNKPATCDEIKNHAANSKFTLVFWGDVASDDFKVFDKLSNGDLSEKFNFVSSDCAECAKEHGANFGSGLTVFRQFDEKAVHSTEFDHDKAHAWIMSTTIPTLQEFSEDSIEGIFGERRQALFLFKKASDEGAHVATFREAASALKGDIIFVTSDVEEGIQGRLGEFVGVTSDMLPTLRILDPAEGMKKFAWDGKIEDLSVDAVKNFVTDFKAGNLTPHLKSEEIPTSTEGDVAYIVGKNFKQAVIDSDDEVLMKFYAPWCGHCKALAPAWEEVATALKDVKGLVIAEFDATANEADGVEIQGYPTLKFYKKGKKHAPLSYEAGRTKEEIIDWLKDNSEAYKAHLSGAHTEDL